MRLSPASCLVPLALVACAGPGASTQDTGARSAQAFRSRMPPAGPAPALVAPVPHRQVLPNNLVILVHPKSDLPVVHARLVLRSGAAMDPAGKEGLADFVVGMLKAGTAELGAKALADEVETRGSQLNVDADEDVSSISFTALRENFEAVFAVLGAVVQRPAFDKEEIERERKRRIAALTQQDDDPRSIADRVFRRVVYGQHPYGNPILGTRQALATITQDDLRKLHDTYYRPNNAALIVTGNVSVNEAVALAQRTFGAWSGSSPEAIAPPVGAEAPGGVYLVHRDDAPQSQLRVGHVGVSRHHPDYFPLLMANAILGGLFNSRINMNLREDKGYTYGARSAFEFLRSQGPFVIQTGVRTDVTAPAVSEIFKEVEALRRSGVTQAELDNARSRYSLSLPGYFQTTGGIASMLENIYVHDLPLDYYQQLPTRLAAVSTEDVARVAREHLREASAMAVVVVGNRDAVREPLSALGPTQPTGVDIYGNKL